MPHTNRYILDKAEKEMYALLLAAMSAGFIANVNYDCGSNGVAYIYGVRVKPQP